MEPGKSVVLTVAADNREEGISLRANTVQRLDDEAHRQNHALRIYLRDQKPLKSIATHLKKKGDSPVSLIVIKGEGGGEVEIALPRDLPGLPAARRRGQGDPRRGGRGIGLAHQPGRSGTAPLPSRHSSISCPS
jgi:hypothetical protein